jgi:hypothetical protein
MDTFQPIKLTAVEISLLIDQLDCRELYWLERVHPIESMQLCEGENKGWLGHALDVVCHSCMDSIGWTRSSQ